MIVLIFSHSLLSGLITFYDGRGEESHEHRDEPLTWTGGRAASHLSDLKEDLEQINIQIQNHSIPRNIHLKVPVA